jgi:hypothetical protein
MVDEVALAVSKRQPYRDKLSLAAEQWHVLSGKARRLSGISPVATGEIDRGTRCLSHNRARHIFTLASQVPEL